MMEFGSWNSVIKHFSSLFDSTAMSVLLSLPGSTDMRDRSTIAPLTPVRGKSVLRMRILSKSDWSIDSALFVTATVRHAP